MNLIEDSGARAPRDLAVRALGVLSAAGGLLGVVTVALPPPAAGSEESILAMSLLTLAIGGWLLLAHPKLSDAAIALLLVLGTALITVTTYEGGAAGGTDGNEMLYLWITLYAFYFLSLRFALAEVAVIGIAFGWLLGTETGPNQALTEWLVTVTTLTVAGLIIARVRGNQYMLVHELSERARRDDLTGLLNRSALDERVANERSRAIREGMPLSVLAVDVDGFKALNDSLGHARGDEVLKKVADELLHRTRKHDAVARLGGDEFAVLLTGASEAAAQVVAEDMRASVAGHLVRDGAGVTVSIGVATGHHPVPPFEDLLRAADGAMYVGKRAGGDRVCVTAKEGLPAAPEAEPVSA